MRVPSILAATLLLSSAAVPCFARPTTHTTVRSKSQHASLKTVAAHTTATHKTLHATVVMLPAHREATPGMDADRATAIQTALIKQGYLTGEPSGTWDPQTAAAMEKLQADNGWQSKITPDARALIKLGLGPQSDHQ